MSRGWTWIEDKNEEELDRIAPTLDALAQEWSRPHDEAERRHFRRIADIEDGLRLRVRERSGLPACEELERLRADQHRAQMTAVEDLRGTVPE